MDLMEITEKERARGSRAAHVFLTALGVQTSRRSSAASRS